MKHFAYISVGLFAGFVVVYFTINFVATPISWYLEVNQQTRRETPTQISQNDNDTEDDSGADDNQNRPQSENSFKSFISDKLLGRENNEATITFIGDIMVDRYVRKIAENTSYDFLFSHVKDRFKESDIVVANLEGPVTNFASISNSIKEEDRFVFTFSEKVLPAMFDANIRIVALDNNHITNFGDSGVSQTVHNLNKNSISYFGNPLNRQILFKNINNLRFAFISYNQFIFPDKEKTIEHIKTARDKTDYVIVFAHWGNEYEIIANQNQTALAHAFVEAGADLIIGAHPHVIQNSEIYQGKLIFYSLGNFIFDQYFSEEVSCGMALTFKFSNGAIKLIEEATVKLSPQKVVEFSEC